MKLWRVQGPAISTPAPEVEEPVQQDRPIGMIEALGLTTGVNTVLRSNVPAKHFAWLFQIRQLQPAMRQMTDQALTQAWDRIRERVQTTPIQSVLPEAFAIMREISRRTMKEEPYEVQLLTAMGLLTNRIVQMKTGEGKSLSIVMAASLAALEGKGVQVIAESTESAQRDAQRYKKLYDALGLRAGIIRDGHQYDPSTLQKEKREAYAADVTYGFADNFIFDRLQDATWTEARMRVQRAPAWAIVDEADNVLLDIAQQPVILAKIEESPHPEWSADLKLADDIVRTLVPNLHFEVRFENERRQVSLTDRGFDTVEAAMTAAGRKLPKQGLTHPTQYPFFHALRQSLLAHHALKSGKHYIGDGVLVNQHNGRAQPLSRFFHGASDAVAMAKGKPLEGKNVVVGQTSYQDFFSSYPNLSGVSGTLQGAHRELLSVYGLQSIEIPTRLPSRLEIEKDEIYVNEFLDRAASIARVLEAHHQSDRPVLFPAVTVAQSKMLTERLKEPLLALADAVTSSLGLLLAGGERLEGGAAIAEKWLARDLETGRDEARQEILELLRADAPGREKVVSFLEEHGLPVRPLLGPPASASLVNAENSDHLAIYVARAGKAGSLTVSTLMGRATDVHPHHDEGLMVICYGHRSSRRDDLQVAGRAGRQGMPGTVQFFSSLNDDTLSGLPAKMLRSLREDLTDHDSLRPTDRQRSRVMRAIRRAQDRIGMQAEAGRISRAKLDRVVAFKRKTLEAEKSDMLERGDLPEVMESWVHIEVGRALIRRQMQGEAQTWSKRQLESFAKTEMNSCWVLTGVEASQILKDAGLPQISEDLDASIPLETLYQHAGVDTSGRTRLVETPEALALTKAAVAWKMRYDAAGMSHKQIERLLTQDATRKIDAEELRAVLAELGLPNQVGPARVGELEDLVHEALAPLLEKAAMGLIEDRPSLTLNQRTRDLLLENLNQIFCDFLEREALYQENLANLVAFADRDPTVEYWARATAEFRRMQADVQRTTARAFTAELSRLAPLAVSHQIPQSLDADASSEISRFVDLLDTLTADLDPQQCKEMRCEEQARALIDGLPKTAARLFGSLVHPVLDRARDYQVGILSREELHGSLLELRLAMIETVQTWPEETKRTVMTELSKHIPRLDPSPRLANPSADALYQRLVIEEMKPRSISKREAGTKPDGSTLMMEEFLVGKVKHADHPFIQSAIDQLAKEGGTIFALAAQDRWTRAWLEHHSPPFFVTDDGKPTIAIDLTRDGAIEALAHEMRHFVRWQERRDQLVRGGADRAIAARTALAIENEPANLIQGETECVAEELRVQREGNIDWNVSGRPTQKEEPGWISRMSYARIQGLRMYLLQEKKGTPNVEPTVRKLIRELIDQASEVRAARARYLDDQIATEQDPGRLLRLHLQQATLGAKSLFDEIFSRWDLELFTSVETDERLRVLFTDEAARAR